MQQIVLTEDRHDREFPQHASVLVAGGGNAGICAAISAAETGASVLLIESLPCELRGGNSKYTRNVRIASDAYPANEMLSDLLKVTGDGIDRDLALFTIEQSRGIRAWMERQGVLWQTALRGTLQLGRTNHFFLGGGKALLNTYYRRAAALGIRIEYDARVTEIIVDRGEIRGVQVERQGERHFVNVGAVVAASGGYESNLAWLHREWGQAADNFMIRGTHANDGLMLSLLLDMGAQPRGNPRGFHAIAVDARSPRFDGGIVTRVDSIPLGVVVNRDCRRFYDEGEDLWPKRYAIWGKLIAEQPDQIAYSIFDAQVHGEFVPAKDAPYHASSIGELARMLQLDPDALTQTIDEYNRHVTPGTYDRTRLDGLTTSGLYPAKSNWARPLCEPPYFGYPLRPGITFTFLGVAVDRSARALKHNGSPLRGIFAAGEIMAGNMLTDGYLAGFGMTIGTVFGMIAGKEAALYARLRSLR